MGNSLRCCLACVLPCGALDLIRIVHLNGYVEEITRAVTAGEILKDYPNHVLSKPCSSQGMARNILILSPHTDLKRGTIYFLIPHSSLPSSHHHHHHHRHRHHRHHHHHPLSSSSSTTTKMIKTHKPDHGYNDDHKPKDIVDVSMDLAAFNHDQNSVNVGVKSKPKSGRHRRRRSSRGKSGVWQPHLQCITED